MTMDEKIKVTKPQHKTENFNTEDSEPKMNKH